MALNTINSGLSGVAGTMAITGDDDPLAYKVLIFICWWYSCLIAFLSPLLAGVYLIAIQALGTINLYQVEYSKNLRYLFILININKSYKVILSRAKYGVRDSDCPRFGDIQRVLKGTKPITDKKKIGTTNTISVVAPNQVRRETTLEEDLMLGFELGTVSKRSLIFF